MSEKLPLGERPPVKIVGNAPEGIKNLIVEHMDSRFGEGHFDQWTEKYVEKLKSAEIDKKPHQLQFINLANEITNRLRTEAGLESYDIPTQNIHYVPGEFFSQVSGDSNSEVNALTSQIQQRILVNVDTLGESVPKEAAVLLHEILHLKEYLAAEVYEKKDRPGEYSFGNHRGGVAVNATAKKQVKKDVAFSAFQGLDEAIVAALEKKYVGEILERSTDPLVMGEMEHLKSPEVLDAKERFAKTQNMPLDEVAWVSRDIRSADIGYSYYRQRRVLNYIIESAYEDGFFSSYDDGLATFSKAHFTGHLVSLAKIIDTTFGKGTFELLGVMKDINSANYILDRLHKKRRLKKAGKEVEK